jgi:hypothetical protein
MDNPVAVNTDEQAEQPTRKAYSSPELADHGSIEALTTAKASSITGEGSEEADSPTP